LLALVALQALVLGGASLAQHSAYNTNAYDLSWFDQLAWNAAHDHPFRSSFVPYNVLGNHFEPVVVLLGGLYRLWASPAALLVLQAVAVSLAAVPLYLAARRLLWSSLAALLIAAAYLLAPQLHRAVLFDFHPELLAPLCLCSAFAALVYQRSGLALVMLSPVFLLKEDAWLIALGFALLCWLLHARRTAAVLFAVAAVYLVVVVGVLMPHVRAGYPGELSRYRYLGERLRDYPVTAIRHPGWVWGHVSQPYQGRQLAGLLASQALLPLAGPAFLVALPLTAAHLLSTHQPQSALDFHYAAAPTVLLFLASVLGVRRLTDWRRSRRCLSVLHVQRSAQPVVLAAVLLLAEGIAYLVSSPLGLPFDLTLYRQTQHTQVVARALRIIPPRVSVSAQTGLLPHLSEREDIHEFPDLGEAAFVAVDRQGRRSSQSVAAGYAAQLAALRSQGYCLRFDDDGVQVYERCPDP